MLIRLSEKRIHSFWSWFASVAQELAADLDNARILADLDSRIAELGNLTWEVGPGISDQNFLAVSPDGVAELLPITSHIVSLAPVVPNWEFHPAKPARGATLNFSLHRRGREQSIDASGWRYVLYRFPDGIFDVVLEQGNLQKLADEDRYSAAVVVLDGLLGEAQRLRCIRELEPVLDLPPEISSKASPIATLADHIFKEQHQR